MICITLMAQKPKDLLIHIVHNNTTLWIGKVSFHSHAGGQYLETIALQCRPPGSSLHRADLSLTADLGWLPVRSKAPEPNGLMCLCKRSEDGALPSCPSVSGEIAHNYPPAISLGEDQSHGRKIV